ncbi:MAG: helix-turn-helix domain-containing protein [Verrucomicrobia bacterium]|nr:helix-turn-helix domain-containing protein [Verrucomicrobiota bacterium]
MPAPNKQDRAARDHRIVETRLPDVLRFLYMHEHVSVAAAASMLAMPPATLYRRTRRFLQLGIAGLASKPDVAATIPFVGDPNQTVALSWLPAVVEHLVIIRCWKPPAAAMVAPASKIHELGERLLRHGLDGIAPNHEQRLRWRAELREFGITPEIVREVELLAVQTGSVPKGWKKFAKSRDCPFRLSVWITKTGPLPESLIRTVRLDPVPAHAWRGGSGCVFVNVAGKMLTLEKPRHAKATKQN